MAKKFDLVVKVADGQNYRSQFSADRNGVYGQLGNINIDVGVTAQNNGVDQTEFVFSLEDSATQDPVSLDDWQVMVFDMDINKRQELHELLCFGLDEINLGLSALPAADQVKMIVSDNKDCAGNPSSAGSMTLESQQIGFLCDNPQSSTDLAEVNCRECFNEAQCAKDSITQFFPIKPATRTATIFIKSRGEFSITFGIKCNKAVGETCNRNFLFSGFYEECDTSAQSGSN